MNPSLSCSTPINSTHPLPHGGEWVSAISRWHLQNGLCLPTAARGICDIWKKLFCLGRKKIPTKCSSCSMVTTHETQSWVYEMDLQRCKMQLCCFILIMPSLFAPLSIQSCKINQLSRGYTGKLSFKESYSL